MSLTKEQIISELKDGCHFLTYPYTVWQGGMHCQDERDDGYFCCEDSFKSAEQAFEFINKNCGQDLSKVTPE
jgi:hypothetical protein